MSAQSSFKRWASGFRGRQMLRLIDDMFKTDTGNDFCYNVLDVSRLQLRNDDLLACNQRWDGMLTRVDPVTSKARTQ